MQEGHAVLNGHVEDIRLQELENADSHRFIATAAESSHGVEPGFTFQFVFGDSFDHVQELLCDEAFEFAEGLLLKNRTYLFSFGGCALAENQLSNFFKQGRGWVPQVPLQFFLALWFSQARGAVSSESAAGKCRTPSLRRQQLGLFAQGLILPVAV